MKNCTPLWRKHLSKSKNVNHVRSTFPSYNYRYDYNDDNGYYYSYSFSYYYSYKTHATTTATTSTIPIIDYRCNYNHHYIYNTLHYTTPPYTTHPR